MPMTVITTCGEMRRHSLSLRKEGMTVGLVPTMGALHEGHLSLLRAAREHCDYVVMSVFVNPTQFGPAEDFDKYPRQLDRDCRLAESAGCGCVFAPSAGEMYPENYSTYVTVENVTAGLCGASRPVHFRGVATVVLKLFNTVMPDAAVFGAKDAQQVIAVRRMVEDLNVPVKIITAPTVREADGLALSSRNAYLSDSERAQAPLIYRGLTCAKEFFEDGVRDAQSIKNHIASIFNEGRLIRPEYIEVVDTVTVKPVDQIDRPVLIAVACRMVESGTRLIDNIDIG